jgi:actin-related protein
MSMHLEKPFLTTTRYKSQTKKSNSRRLAEANAKHNEWLEKQGLTPNQIKLKKAFIGNVVRESITDSNMDRNPHELSNNLHVGGGGYKKGIMANLHKEKPEVQKEILDKASRVMPLFNKGGLQYLTPGEDIKTVGTKSRRG